MHPCMGQVTCGNYWGNDKRELEYMSHPVYILWPHLPLLVARTRLGQCLLMMTSSWCCSRTFLIVTTMSKRGVEWVRHFPRSEMHQELGWKTAMLRTAPLVESKHPSPHYKGVNDFVGQPQGQRQGLSQPERSDMLSMMHLCSYPVAFIHNTAFHRNTASCHCLVSLILSGCRSTGSLWWRRSVRRGELRRMNPTRPKIPATSHSYI